MTQYEMDMLYGRCRQEAINAGALRPRGFGEGLAANVLESGGGSFAATPLAQGRLKRLADDIFRQRLRDLGY